MLNLLLRAAILLFALATAHAQGSAELVGRYQLEVSGGDVLELRADGSAQLGGEATRWSVRGNVLTVGTDAMPLMLTPERLVLVVGGMQTAWKRLGGVGRMAPVAAAAVGGTRAPTTVTAASPGPAGNAQDTQARQLLTGSAWCSFTYNKVSGTSSTRRVVFRPDGLMLVGGGAETYSAGAGGIYAGQSSRSGAMRWRFENLRLFVDPGDGGGFQDVGLSATQNSSGAVILRADGREYAMCR